MTRRLFTVFLLTGLASFLGCSQNVKLSGTVTYQDDGSPVTRGAVFFETPTLVAQGDIQSDGTYVVGSTGLNDGLPKGEYSVSIRGADEITFTPGAGGSQVERRKALIDPKYQRADSSGLTFTVDGKTKKFDIKVDRAK